MRRESVLENLNGALAELFAEDPKTVFIGEDVADPYGGAFKVSKGLSAVAPDRVVSTPISEESFTGMAAGMALMGWRPVVDLMFSDFSALAFDPVVNFASKAVSMYGRRQSIQMVVRCANGGYRGYGATHSQSMQKYFMGVPNLCVYELTPFHDNKLVFKRMLGEHMPCVFFEEKSLYSHKQYKKGDADDGFKVSYRGPDDNWAVVSIDGGERADVAILCHGGLSKMCLDAARSLLMEDEIESKMLIPSKLYPGSIEDIMEECRTAGRLLIAEESTGGNTWGDGVVGRICANYHGTLPVKIGLLHSDDSIIPASIAYENRVLVSEAKIIDAVKALLKV